MKVIGILLAAGSSKRFEADKLFIEYEDRELIRFPIETFLKNKNIKQTTEELNEAIKSGDEQQVKYATQSAYNYGIDPGTIYKNAMTFQFYQNEAKNEANRRENATTAALSRTLHSS